MAEENTVKKKYEVSYHIKHGVSSGFCMKYDDETEKKEEFEALDAIDAIFKVEERAWFFANEYISNYSEGKTTVKIMLFRENGIDINMLEELARRMPTSKKFDDFKKQHFSDREHYTVERTMLDHLLDNIPF